MPDMLQIAGTYLVFHTIPNWFVALRVVVLVVMLWISALTLYQSSMNHEIWWHFIWLTSWTQSLCLITAAIRLTSTLIVRNHNNQYSADVSTPNQRARYDTDRGSMLSSYSCLFTVQCKLQRIALPMVTLIALQYWIMEFDASKWTGDLLTEMDRIQSHGVNAILMWTDYLLSAERIYYRSAILPIVFGVIYVVWTVVFEFTFHENPRGDPWIYESMDWSSGWRSPLGYFGIGAASLVLVSWIAAFLKNSILKAMERMREAQSPSTGSVVNRFMCGPEDVDEDDENEHLML